MDKGTFLSIIKRLVQSIRVFFEIVGIAQTILGLIGGGVVIGAIIASLQKVPSSVAIGLFVVALIALGYAIVKTRYRYRRWNDFRNIPELDNVLEKAFDIHIRIGELHDEVVEQNKRKNIKTKVREALAEKFLEILKIPLSELVEGVNPDGTPTKKLYRKMSKIFRLKAGDYFTLLPLLKDYGRLLNRNNLGLRDAIEVDAKGGLLKGLNNDFMKSQLALDIHSKAIDYVNNLPELSYGLNSISLGVNLIQKGRTWYKDVPESYIKQKEESRHMINTAYLSTSMWVKHRVKLAMFEEALK